MATTPFQIDYTNKDYEAFRSMMINSIPLYTPEWTDKSESDFGIVVLELLAMGLDVLSYYQDRAANENYLPTAQQRKSIINISKLVGYTLSNASPAKVYLTFTLTSPAPTGGFVIPAGTQVSTQPSTTTDPIIFETDATFVIPATKYGNEVDGMGNALYPISATQGQTVGNEILGSSDGITANLQFTLKFSPVINDSSFKVYVTNLAGIQQQWTSVTDFINSQPTDMNYTVAINELSLATITFGTGSSGAVPSSGVNNIISTYRIGGGIIGNVGSGTLTNLITNISGITSVNNPNVPYIMGTDAEDINHAKVMAPVLYKTNRRAVTLQDFSDLVTFTFSTNLTTPIFKATALNVLASWDFDVQLYCLRSDLAALSGADITAIHAYIDTVRLINSKVQVLTAVQVVPVVSLTVTLQSSFLQSIVKSQVTQALLSYLQTTNFSFGQPLLLSSLMNIVMGVQGVQNVSIQLPVSDLTMAAYAILQTILAGNLTVNVVGGVIG